MRGCVRGCVCGLCASVCVSSFCLFTPTSPVIAAALVCVCVLLMMFEIVKQMQRHVPKIKTQQIREEALAGGIQIRKGVRGREEEGVRCAQITVK